MSATRAEHKHSGNIIAPCLKCGLPAWQHRTRETRVQTGRIDTRRGRKRVDTRRNRKRDSNHARDERRELKTFIGLDGEGVTRPDGTHDYVLLTIGKESLVHRGPGRLTWREIFPFLYECFQKDPHAAYVGYFLGYDFTQWIRTLSQNRAESLWTPHGIARRKRGKSGPNPTPFPVYVGDDENPYQWEIDTLGMRRFKIRKGLGKWSSAESPNDAKWMHICDAGSFFQQSFLKTLRDFRTVIVKDDDIELREYLEELNIPVVDGKAQLVKDEEYQRVEEGKKKRATAELDDDMIAYNLLECDLLGRIMPLLHIGFHQMGIDLSREKWFGPGQAAQAWMTNIGAPTAEAFSHPFKSRGEEEKCSHKVREKLRCDRLEEMHAPSWAREIGRLTYFGGWFEIFCHGLVPGPSYEYDINSAYPEQIAKLPCLLHGKWERGKAKAWRDIPQGRTLCAVKGDCIGRDPRVGSMMHRAKDCSVLRPQLTHGWYWLHELEAAKRAGVLAEFIPQEWISYEGCDHPPPFSAMKSLYEERLKVGKETPRGKSFKLVYNSSYGKTAQSVGSPKFANGIYASLITCGCRTTVLNAIETHPTGTRDLLMVATDGAYFRTPHPKLEISKTELGKWGSQHKKDCTNPSCPGCDSKQNLFLLMPGLYWDDKARESLQEGKDVALKSRGVPGRDMARKILEADELFSKFKPGDPWPKIELSIAFGMVTVGQAVDRGKWDTCGTTFSNAKRLISMNPEKKRRACWQDGDVIRSDPYQYAPKSDYASLPYDRRFGDELKADKELLGDMTPEGLAGDLMIEELRG